MDQSIRETALDCIESDRETIELLRLRLEEEEEAIRRGDFWAAAKTATVSLQLLVALQVSFSIRFGDQKPERKCKATWTQEWGDRQIPS